MQQAVARFGCIALTGVARCWEVHKLLLLHPAAGTVIGGWCQWLGLTARAGCDGTTAVAAGWWSCTGC
jgi:hypothetical protein